MPTLQLTTTEANVLKEVLENVLGELRTEIADTDLRSYRDKLKEKELVIITLSQRLGMD